MRHKRVNVETIKLVGLSVRTNNKQELQSDKAKIGATVNWFHQESIAEQIPHRSEPGVSYAVYTQYESDAMGDYTYFIGEAVSSHDDIPEGLTAMTIQPGRYYKLTPAAGPMPAVAIQAWETIWGDDALSQQRQYQTDFEVYDHRARDPSNTELDIYIGIRE